MTRKHDARWESTILRRIRAGDRAAQRELILRYGRPLSRQALLVLKNPALAEDVVQETWVTAFASIDRFRGQSRLLTWLTGIAINRAKSERRRERRFAPVSRVRGPPTPAEGEDLELVVHELTPERILMEREVRRHFDAAVGSLPEGQRSVVVLRDVEESSSSETCRVLDISDAAQRVRLCRARARLRLALAEFGPPPDPSAAREAATG